MTGTDPTFGKQLEYLNDRMKDVSATANQFLAKFFFGGLVAVIAVLNLDLVLLGEQPDLSLRTVLGFAVLVVVVIRISQIYFRTVYEHYDSFRSSHRKLKYKYELTLHAMLCRASSPEYATMLEESVAEQPDPNVPDEFPGKSGASVEFADVSSYLLHHHRRRFHDLSSSRETYVKISLLLVYLTLAARGAGILIGG